MKINTAYFMLWSVRESRRSLAATSRGDVRAALLHLTNASRHLGTAATNRRPGHLSEDGYWARLSVAECACDKARLALARASYM